MKFGMCVLIGMGSICIVFEVKILKIGLLVNFLRNRAVSATNMQIDSLQSRTVRPFY